MFAVTGVPTFVMNGRGVVGAQPYAALEQLVIAERRRKAPDIGIGLSATHYGEVPITALTGLSSGSPLQCWIDFNPVHLG